MKAYMQTKTHGVASPLKQIDMYLEIAHVMLVRRP